MKIIVTALLSVGLHLSLGWEWTVLAGLVAGGWAPRPLEGGLVGAGGTALGLAVFVVHTAVVAPASLRVLLDTVGGLAGNIPGEALVGATVLVGGVIGLLGGSIGATLRPLLADPSVFG